MTPVNPPPSQHLTTEARSLRRAAPKITLNVMNPQIWPTTLQRDTAIRVAQVQASLDETRRWSLDHHLHYHYEMENKHSRERFTVTVQSAVDVWHRETLASAIITLRGG